MIDFAAYFGLFFAALLAATILPLQSEWLLVGLLIADEQPVWLLLTVATAGNVLGSTINWWLGKYLEKFQDRRWFPLTPTKLQQAIIWYQKYGRWSLWLSWVPIIGDPLTVVSGLMRVPMVSFLVIVTLAKLARYLLVAALTLGW